MPSADYRFVTRWRVPGTPQLIYDMLSDTEDVARWWPALYHRVTVTDPGVPHGPGKTVDVESKGFLPYTLKWSFRVTEVDEPNGYALEAWGELIGTGRWTFRADGEWTDVTYDWNVRAAKPLLRYLSPILRPFFSANHNYVMRQGEKGLRAELAKKAFSAGLTEG